LSWIVHPYFALGVLVNTKRDLFIFVVVNGIKMFKESLSKDKVFVVKLVKLVFDDCKLALVGSLEKV